MATRTVPFCLEMLTFGYPESPALQLSPALSSSPAQLRRTPGRQLTQLTRGGPMATRTGAFMLGNAYIWLPRELGALLLVLTR